MGERAFAGVAGLASLGLALALLAVAPVVDSDQGDAAEASVAAVMRAVQEAPRDARAWLALAQARLAEEGAGAGVEAAILQSYRAGPRDARVAFPRLAFALALWPLWGREVREAALAELEGLAAWPEAAGVTRGFLHDPTVWPQVCAMPWPDRAAVMALSQALSERRAREPLCPA